MSEDRSRAERVPGQPREADSARERWLDRLLDLFHLRSRESFRDDLEDALAETAQGFSPQERAMLQNVLGFHRLRVEDVMVPRADIVAIAADTTLGDLLGLFRTAGHSRLPVYGETLDDPKGMVHIRDFLDYLAARSESGGPRRRQTNDGKPPNLGEVDLSITLATAKILRPVLYVPRSMPAVDLLVRMQATRTHMALVIDEYGGTDGLVSIEDIVEAVVGDIEDEHDEAEELLIQSGEGASILVDARAGLEEVSQALGIDVAGGHMADEVETIGGLIVTLAGRVPSRGELICGPQNLEFEVLDADPRRVKRLRIERRDPKPTEETRPASKGAEVLATEAIVAAELAVERSPALSTRPPALDAEPQAPSLTARAASGASTAST
jgi:CBS domain containing-hemolysin-like protein